jgi:hypothetical protein
MRTLTWERLCLVRTRSRKSDPHQARILKANGHQNSGGGDGYLRANQKPTRIKCTDLEGIFTRCRRGPMQGSVGVKG